jgi:hypothetical protein
MQASCIQSEIGRLDCARRDNDAGVLVFNPKSEIRNPKSSYAPPVFDSTYVSLARRKSRFISAMPATLMPLGHTASHS